MLVGDESRLLVNPRLRIETWGTRFCNSFQTWATRLREGLNECSTFPQRLKPRFKCSIYGTAKAVPLSKTNTEILAAPE
jgi:hypothetical protein